MHDLEGRVKFLKIADLQNHWELILGKVQFLIVK